jgi:hypothetical protein
VSSRVETCIRLYEQHDSLSEGEEFHMKILTQYAVCALAVALMVPLARGQSQPTGLQAAFAKDAGTLSDKFTGLTRVISGKYDWKPGQGLRSVGDVFNLIVTENRMLVDNSIELAARSIPRFCRPETVLETLVLDFERIAA